MHSQKETLLVKLKVGSIYKVNFILRSYKNKNILYLYESKNIISIKLTFIWGIPGRFDQAEKPSLFFLHSSMLWMVTKKD